MSELLTGEHIEDGNDGTPLSLRFAYTPSNACAAAEDFIILPNGTELLGLSYEDSPIPCSWSDSTMRPGHDSGRCSVLHARLPNPRSKARGKGTDTQFQVVSSQHLFTQVALRKISSRSCCKIRRPRTHQPLPCQHFRVEPRCWRSIALTWNTWIPSAGAREKLLHLNLEDLKPNLSLTSAQNLAEGQQRDTLRKDKLDLGKRIREALRMVEAGDPFSDPSESLS